jgi:hypothetical protein
LLDGVTVMLVVVALLDHNIVPPGQPLAVKTRLCPSVMVAGLVVLDVILTVGGFTEVTVIGAVVNVHDPFVTKSVY